jgi:hypothetical protein
MPSYLLLSSLLLSLLLLPSSSAAAAEAAAAHMYCQMFMYALGLLYRIIPCYCMTKFHHNRDDTPHSFFFLSSPFSSNSINIPFINSSTSSTPQSSSPPPPLSFPSFSSCLTWSQRWSPCSYGPSQVREGKDIFPVLSYNVPLPYIRLSSTR